MKNADSMNISTSENTISLITVPGRASELTLGGEGPIPEAIGIGSAECFNDPMSWSCTSAGVTFYG